MHTSQNSLSECFCLVVMWRYFLFRQRPQATANIHWEILQIECFKVAESKERFNSVSWMHTSRRSLSQCFCLVFYEDISFSTIGLKAIQRSTFKFYKKCVSKLPNQKQGSTLWDECTHHKEVCQNASLQFYCEAISFSTRGLKAIQMSTCRFYKNTVSKLLSQKNSSTLWDECSHYKEVCENSSV